MAGLYERLGVDTSRLGCVMLDCDVLDTRGHVADALWSDGVLPWGASASEPREEAHVTLLYGLLQPAPVWRDEIAEVLDGWTPPDVVTVSAFAVWPQDAYDCVVGLIRDAPDYQLTKAHDRLSKLPHINTYPYQPHVTIGYARPGLGRYVVADLERLQTVRPVMQLMTHGLNFEREE